MSSVRHASFFRAAALSLLMVSMSISVGIVEISRTPWLIEDAQSELEPPVLTFTSGGLHRSRVK